MFDIKDLHTITKLDESDCSVFGNCFSILCGSSKNVEFSIRGDLSESSVQIKSKKVTQEMKNSHNSTQTRTTENAACAVAFVVINKLANYVITHQCCKGDYFDYYIEKQNEQREEKMLQNSVARLEVSGIKEEKAGNTIRDRIKDKILQVEKNRSSNLPCYIIVSEFSNKISEVKLYERNK